MKISIITASFNSEKTIEETIKSVISQNEGNVIEYILIDGGSSDRTMEIVEKYKKHFAKVISEKDRGISDAFNKGISLATGDIIGLINSDDILYEGAIEQLINNFETGIDIYYGDKIVVDKVITSRSYQKANKLENIKYSLPFCHQSCFISKKCYEKFGLYSTKFKYCMDFDLILKMYKGKAKFKYIPYPLCEFSFGGASDSYKTLREVFKISIDYGLPKINAMYYFLKCFARSFTKTILIKLNLLNFARMIRNKSSVKYDTEY
ncbi:glycosyltransferase family 2 protein [Cytobacillus firmus]|uniref:glycosyltransferase family 2 protein n=1 Tax=Cytobacillus firmus TaxID=1399 RepID=UPI0024C10EB1|nr:glycosyltransferase family 2 protein [Cytobacillus firmus]WHY61511.1 glycosyltransferase family 2 protein [Cytobacillus firmus]